MAKGNFSKQKMVKEENLGISSEKAWVCTIDLPSFEFSKLPLKTLKNYNKVLMLTPCKLQNQLRVWIFKII